MKSASVSDRGKPVARIESCRAADLTAGEVQLVRRGLADPPRARLDLERFLSAPAPRLPVGLSASRLIVAERDGGPVKADLDIVTSDVGLSTAARQDGFAVW